MPPGQSYYSTPSQAFQAKIYALEIRNAQLRLLPIAGAFIDCPWDISICHSPPWLMWSSAYDSIFPSDIATTCFPEYGRVLDKQLKRYANLRYQHVPHSHEISPRRLVTGRPRSETHDAASHRWPQKNTQRLNICQKLRHEPVARRAAICREGKRLHPHQSICWL
jgi:hypothetical protein